MSKLKDYPTWICQECGSKYHTGGGTVISTWHKNKCDVCGKQKYVTEPRDFGYPKFPGHISPEGKLKYEI